MPTQANIDINVLVKFMNNNSSYKFELDQDENNNFVIYVYDETHTMIINHYRLFDASHAHHWVRHPGVYEYKVCSECNADNYEELNEKNKETLELINKMQNKYNKSKREHKNG